VTIEDTGKQDGARTVESVARHGYTVAEAAASLAMSESSFRRHVLAKIRVTRVGRLVVIRPSELERWLERHQALSDG
jgi:excisionase family DNA binding protein